MQYAIDNGFEGISFINGLQSGLRWDALTYVDKIGYTYNPIALEKLPETTQIVELTEGLVHKEGIESDNGNVLMQVSHPSGGGSAFVDQGSTHIYFDGTTIKGINFEDIKAIFEHREGGIQTIEDAVLTQINVDRSKNPNLKEYDVTLYSLDGRTTDKFMNEQELIDTFGHRAKQMIDGEYHSMDEDGVVKFLEQVDQMDIIEGKSGEFFLRFYNEDIPNTVNKILSEYDLKLEDVVFSEGNNAKDITTQKTVIFNDKIINERKDKPTPSYKIKKHKFKSGQTETLFNDAKISTKQDGPTFIENTKTYLASFKNAFTRHYPNMPKGGKFAIANDILRRYETSGDYSDELAFYYINDIVGDMDANTFHNFERSVVLLDIYSDYQQGKPVTYFKMTEETFLAEYDAIQKIIESDPNLQKALERRKEIQKTIVGQLVELDILDGDVVAKNPNYYHHQVLMYQQILMD